MVVRELLIGLGFSLDESKANRADQKISSIKEHATSAVAMLGRMAAVVGLALGGAEIIKIGDEWTNVNGQIGLVTNSTEEQAAMQQEVFRIAQKTRQEYGATGKLFVKMARNSEELGSSQKETLDVTETVNKALVVGQASAAEANSTLLQLGQALSSGRLQGDELRSLSENAPILFRAIADHYGVTIGKLKEMGAQGELTSEGVFKAILKAKARVDKEFEKMPVTIEQSVTYALNRIGSVIFGLNKETSVFQHIASGIMKSADGIAGAIEKGIKIVGGWTNALRLATAALISFGIAFVIVREGLFTLEMWNIALQILRIGVVNLARSFIAFLLNPAFLTIAAITLALVGLGLVLEDIYYWVTGGDSVLGDWLGSWETFKTKVMGWLTEIRDTLVDIIDKAAQVTGISAGYKKMQEVVQDNPDILDIPLGNLSGGYSPSSVSPSDLVRASGGGPVTITIGETNIEQNIAGTGERLATDIGDATATATKDRNDKFARDIEYAIPGGVW